MPSAARQLLNQLPKSMRENSSQLIKSCGTRTDPAAETKSIGLSADAQLAAPFCPNSSVTRPNSYRGVRQTRVSSLPGRRRTTETNANPGVNGWFGQAGKKHGPPTGTATN